MTLHDERVAARVAEYHDTMAADDYMAALRRALGEPVVDRLTTCERHCTCHGLRPQPELI